MSYTNGLDKPDDYFNIVLYTGTGSSQTPSNGWRPDLSVIKVRSLGTQGWVWADRVRGDEKTLKSNGTDAEETRPNAFSGWTSDGITVVSEGRTNSSGETYANWNWLASGGTASSNTDGSITSSVSANTTSGFSIVTYTLPSSGTVTVGHGLGVKPDVLITKSRDNAYNWDILHKSINDNGVGRMIFTTDAYTTSSNPYASTTPTSSVFSFSADFYGASDNVTYCFAEKKATLSLAHIQVMQIQMVHLSIQVLNQLGF